MKYMGSKNKIAKHIVPIIHNYMLLNNIDIYIEPFAGGCNMLDKVNCKNRYAFDKNKYLIALFQYLQNEGELPESVSREQYNDCRAHYKAKDNYYPDWYLGAVGFLASYNGRFYDGGYAGTFCENGKQRDYYSEAKENIINQMISLMDVKFDAKDYRELNVSDALIYCDPPYAKTKGYCTSKGFNHSEFWSLMREWSKHNIVLISEENAPDDFIAIWEQEVSRDIDVDNKKKAIEKLFIHKTLYSNTYEQNGYDF